MFFFLYVMHQIHRSIAIHNNSSNYTIKEAVLYEREPLNLSLGEAAISGMIPTSIIILLMAIIRILQMLQRRRAPHPDDIRNSDTKSTIQL